MDTICIVFDSTAFIGFGIGGKPKPLDTINGEIILKLKEKGKVKLFISSVVLQEVSRQWFDGYLERRNKLESSIEKFNSVVKMLDANFTFVFPPSFLKESFYRVAEDYFVGKGIDILPMPDVSIEELLLRDIDKRKPFSEKGKGFRDALTWESIRKLHSLKDENSSKIIFVTNDRDFSDDGSNLHEDLRKDFVGADQDVVLVRDLEALLNHSLIGPLVPEIQHEIWVDGEIDRIKRETKKKTTEELEGLIDKPVSLFDYGEPGGVGGGPIGTPIVDGEFVDIHVIEESIECKIYNLSDMSSDCSDLLTIKVEVDAECVINGHVNISDYIMHEWDVEIIDCEQSDHVMRVEEVRTLHFTLRGEVPNQVGTSVSLSIEDVCDIYD